MTVDISAVEAMFTGVIKKLEGPEPINMATRIIQQSTKDNITLGGRPQAFKPLKYRSGKPLFKTGKMYNSIRRRREGRKGTVTAHSPYAAPQHFGTGRGVPARPFFHYLDEDVVKIEKEMVVIVLS